MRLGRPEAASEVRSLSRWERAGVRGYGLSLVPAPHPTCCAIDLSPPGRGELDHGQADSIKVHLALDNFRTINAACRRTIPERIAVRPAAVSAGRGIDARVRHHGLRQSGARLALHDGRLLRGDLRGVNGEFHYRRAARAWRDAAARHRAGI